MSIVILIAGSIEAIFFALVCIRFFPAVFKLGIIFFRDSSSWPGPIIMYPIGRFFKEKYLFPYFLQSFMGIFTACIAPILLILFDLFRLYAPVDEILWNIIAIICLISAPIKALLSLKPTLFTHKLINQLDG